jgi:hypothetical protein
MSIARIQRPAVVTSQPITFLPPPHKLKVGAKPLGKDPIQIRGGVLRGNQLELTVSHTGGARTHGYQLAWRGGFLETFPVQTGLTLSHNAHGDRAEAMVTKKLSIDLTPMRDAYKKMYQTEHGTIRFNVAGLGRSFTYDF